MARRRAAWEQFADNMRQVMPDRAVCRSRCLPSDLPCSSSPSGSLDIFRRCTTPASRFSAALFEDNDRAKRLQTFICYNTDISQFWEWSGRGFRPIDDTNEAYKLGVNAIIYGLTIVTGRAAVPPAATRAPFLLQM